MPVKIVLVYGPGPEVALFSNLQDELAKAYSFVTEIKRVGRDEYETRQLDEPVLERINSLSQDLQTRLLRRASPIRWFLTDPLRIEKKLTRPHKMLQNTEPK